MVTNKNHVNRFEPDCTNKYATKLATKKCHSIRLMGEFRLSQSLRVHFAHFDELREQLFSLARAEIECNDEDNITYPMFDNAPSMLSPLIIAKSIITRNHMMR